MTNERDLFIQEVRANLKRRSGKSWSVRGGRGSVWGWVTISAPPARLVDGWKLSDEDREELSGLLGEIVHSQGIQIPAGTNYRREYLDRSAGRTPSVVGTPYWD